MDAARQKVLVVDDEHTVADTLSRIFSTNGYEARAAYSAEQAIEISVEWIPNLFVIDVILPRMNGIDLAILLQEQFPKCRLILFSGQASTAELLTDAVTKGHNFEILAKPVHPSEMLNTALQVLDADRQEQHEAGPIESETAPQS